jgi:demethylmenaquinone methyltransferase/2-methoxy-6-polyprenyl-1,4-benzoquinol methylase
MNMGMNTGTNTGETSGNGPTAGRPESEKVRSMFSQIAGRYDLANNVLSGGVHHLWRTKVVDWSEAKAGDKILDCATGTGDLAIAFKSVVGPLGDVTGTDFCEEMMTPAPGKAEGRGLQVKFSQADVMALPFNDATFDISSISFGIRNVSDAKKGISELARVVKSGGQVMILEFGQPKTPGIAQAYKLYSEKVLPTLGGWITGQKAAYEYLQNSSSQFPCREEFVALMRSTGRFSSIEYVPVTFGVAYVYKGTVR